MTPTAITNATAQSTAGSSSARTAGPQVPGAQHADTTVDASDFETFLQMLTTQIQNQDPLNPMQSSDFAVQLATFSGVEQQVQTNELLRNFVSASAGAGLETYAGWIGMEARLTGTVAADGTPKTLHFDVPRGSQRTDLVVKGQDGVELHRLDITGQEPPYTWDGRTPAGRALPDGDYILEVAALGAGGNVETAKVSTYASVAEVRSAQDGIRVVTADGRELPTSEITAIRQP